MRLLAALLCLTLLAGAREVCEIQYPGKAGPVTFGLPFPAGVLHHPEQLLLNGQALQTRVNARWPDGSLKWLLLDTYLPENFRGSLRIEPEVSSPAGAPLAQGNRLSNGRLHLDIPASGPLFTYTLGDDEGSAELFLKLQHDPPGETQEENWLVEAGESNNCREFSSAADTNREIHWEENGPLRASCRIAGWFTAADGRKAYRYIVRLTVYRDEDTLKIQTTFINTEEVQSNFLRSLVLRLNRKGQPVPAQLIVGTPRFHHLISWRDKIRPEISGCPGFLTSGKLTAVARDFQRLYPKELCATATALEYHLWPERSGKVLDLRRRTGQRREYLDYQNDAGGMGVAKTHDLFLTWNCPEPEYFAHRCNQPCLPAARPEYYRSTLAAGEYHLADHTFPRTEAAIRFAFQYLRKLRQAGQFDGMMDWGDVPLGVHGTADHLQQRHPEGAPFRGYTGWQNNDLALNHSFYLHFLRSGDQEVLRDGLAMTWHVLDVDTVHHWPEDPTVIGKGRRHDQQHWGSGISYGYALDSALYMYLLTGEHRALEVVKNSARTAFYGRYINIRLWELTGEQEYLERAEKYLQTDEPFPKAENFRGNSYDSPGYIFYDSIRPNDLLREKVMAAGHRLAPRYLSCYANKGYPPYAVLALAHKYDPSPENAFTLKILLNQLQRYLPQRPEDLEISDQAPMDEFDALNGKIANITNTGVLSLLLLTALPYSLERLKIAGISEEEALNFRYSWTEPESFSEELNTAVIKPSPYPQIRAWNYSVANPSFPDWGVDRFLIPEDIPKYRAAISRYKLYEDGILIGPNCFAHALINRNGLMGWSHLGKAISFTTPDNSNPAENQRRYLLEYTSAADWRWQDRPSFSETLEIIYPYPDLATPSQKWCSPLKHESPDQCLVYPVPAEVAAKVKAAWQRHLFTEDEQPLTTWQREQNLIVFQTSDGSDPRQNGRTYRLKYTCGEE